jgi:hypothetical protein
VYFYDYQLANQVAMPVDGYFANTGNCDYFLISHNGFYNKNQVDFDDNVVDQVLSGSIKLLFDFSFEGDYFAINRFIERMDALGIEPSMYRILSGAGYLNGSPHPAICHCPMFETKAFYGVKENLSYQFGFSERKKFIMLNARPRTHRLALTYLLHERNLLDQGYCSFPAECNELEHYDFDHTIHVLEQDNFVIDRAQAKQLKQSLPLKVDDISLTDSMAINDGIISPDYQYVDFAVITESLVNSGNDSVFITEKIMKAIVNKVPFVVLGDKHTLQYMQGLGYKTFDFLINESYDSLDYHERIHAIVDEIERLCDIDFAKYQEQIARVTEYNYNLMMQKDFYQERIEHMINFLK